MRVAITYPGCHRRGGVERVMLECVNFLAEKGHDVQAIASDWDLNAISPLVTRHEVPKQARVPAARAPIFRRQIKEIVAGLTPPPDVTAGFGINTPPGGVVWMTSVHAAWIEISRASRPIAGRIKQRLNPFHPMALALERAQLEGRDYSHVIALTDDVKADVMRIYGVPPQDITVIPNGYSEREFFVQEEGSRASKRASLGLSPDDRVVVFVANELERKGFKELLEGVRIAGDTRIHVLAVGRFSHLEATLAVRQAGLEGRVHLTGPSSDVAGLYAAADVFALPTKYEAWGLVVLEAMACGLPVLTSRLAGVATAVKEGTNGLLLDDPSDGTEIAHKLTALLDGRHAPADEISRSVREFRWSVLLTDYEQVLRSQSA